MDGLTGNESYDLNKAENGSSFTLVFYQDADKTVTGLTGTGSKRTITVTYTTALNGEWLSKHA